MLFFKRGDIMKNEKDKAKSIDELYSDYKLFYAKRYIEIAKTKEDLFDAVKGLPMFEVCEREDIINAFSKKALELGIDEDKLFSWLEDY